MIHRGRIIRVGGNQRYTAQYHSRYGSENQPQDVATIDLDPDWAEGLFYSNIHLTEHLAISPDGRFIVVRQAGVTDDPSSAHRVVIVQHWLPELLRLVPTH